MDFQKTKIFLDKLNREFARMSKDPENTVRLDIDIMASYVRDLYDAILSESNNNTPPKTEQAPVRHPHRPVVVEPIVEVAPPVVVETPAPPSPVREEPPAPAPPPTPSPVVEEVPKPVATVRSTAPSAVGVDSLFEEKQAKELSEKLADAPIADLKKAIALNDRLLFTSELFAADGKAFENALAALNGFSSFEEARAYLIDNCVTYYTWTDKKHIETAKTFIKLVRRRYK